MTDADYAQAVAKLKAQIEAANTALVTHPPASEGAARLGQADGNTLPQWWSTSSAMTISSAVLLFGCLICLIAAHLMRKGQTADSILKLFGTIMIVTAALFLVVAGYSDQQISPVMGLLGTIAGYLLGKNTGGEEPHSKAKPQ